jgi:hypothetical protein
MLILFRRWPRVAFFALGLLTAALCGWFLVNWLEIATDVFGMKVIYATRPAWLRALMAAAQWLPWVALAVLTLVRINRGRVVRPIAFAAGAASVYVLAVGSLFLGPAIENYWHQREFEPVAWRGNDRGDAMWPARLTMVDDLLARHPLRGLSRDSVERLLGPRDSTEYFREWDLVYWLGPERGFFRIDSEWLVLDIGLDGRVSDYRIVRD